MVKRVDTRPELLLGGERDDLESKLVPKGVIDDPEQIASEFRLLYRRNCENRLSLSDTFEIVLIRNGAASPAHVFRSPVVLLDLGGDRSNGNGRHLSFFVDMPRGSLADLIDVGTELLFKYGDPKKTQYVFRSKVREITRVSLPRFGDREFPVYRVDLPDSIIIRAIRRSYILDIENEIGSLPEYKNKPLYATVVVHSPYRLGKATGFLGRVNPTQINEFNLIDISVDAVKICSERRFKEGEVFDLTINLPPDKTIKIKGAEVTRSNIYSRVHGQPTIFTVLSYGGKENYKAYRAIQNYINHILTRKKQR